jgi:pyruvate,water dikinase
MRPIVIGLSEKRAQCEDLAGGKATALARLWRRGFKVPQGFVISADVFRQIIRGCITGSLDSMQMPPEQETATRIRKCLLTTPLPSKAVRETIKAFGSLGAPVAVRSSLVGEDSVTTSFAGQLETSLNVTDESGLINAVRKCYASLFSNRSLRYITARTRSPSLGSIEDMAVAVLVQRMVPALAAGIAFSADPDTGRFCIIIEAACGPAADVVGGRADPDRYVLDARGVLTESRIVVPGSPVLNQKLITELGEIVRGASREMGRPQDIEWAYDGRAFQILQARPITSLAGKTVYSKRLASDMAPGLIKPLMWSTNIVDMTRNVFERIFDHVLGPNDIDYTQLVGWIRHRVFANITLFADLFGRLGLPINLFEVIARDESAIHGRPRPTRRLLKSLGRLLPFVVRHAWIRRRAEAFIRKHDRRLARYRGADWSQLQAEELLKEVIELRQAHGETQWFMWLTAVNMNARNKLLARSIRHRAQGIDPNNLLAGYVGLRSLEPNRALMDIADRIRRLGPGLIDLMEDADDDLIRRRLGQTDERAQILRRFDEFMERYGYLGTSGTDFTVSPWIEKPDVVWKNIHRMAVGPDKPVPTDARAIREEAHRRVLKSLSWAARIKFKRLLSETVTYLRLRERISFLMSEDSYQMRRIYLAMGERLVGSGLLEQAEDLFFLMFNELEDLIRERLDRQTVGQLLAARKTDFAADSRTEIDDVVCGEAPVMEPQPLPHSVTHLEGIAGSPGILRGYARVVTDPGAIDTDLTEHDILIVPFMDVGWTPLFASIGGIVAETGGRLSHSAIVAREYGLPAVVSVKRATLDIEDGQAITIDGTIGRVYLSHVE